MSCFAPRLLASGLVAAAILIAAGESAIAARLLAAQVEVDGKLVLQTTYTDSGTEPPETVWRYLASEPGWAETAKIVASESDPQRARLEGSIVIRVQHTTVTIAEARATELELIRAGSPGDLWYLPAAEVERIAAANGIPPAPAQLTALGQGPRVWIIGGLAAMALAVLLLVWVVWPKSRAAEQ